MWHLSVCSCFFLQVNPSLTLSLLATRKLDVLRALVYIAAQCFGACLAAWFLYLALPFKTTAEHFVNRVSSQMSVTGKKVRIHYSVFNREFASFSTQYSAGAHWVKCSSGFGHRGFVHLSDGLHCLFSGGSETERQPRTRKLGHWSGTLCWSTYRGERNYFPFILGSFFFFNQT